MGVSRLKKAGQALRYKSGSRTKASLCGLSTAILNADLQAFLHLIS